VEAAVPAAADKNVRLFTGVLQSERKVAHLELRQHLEPTAGTPNQSVPIDQAVGVLSNASNRNEAASESQRKFPLQRRH